MANLLRAAEQLFATTGYEAATMAGIAQLAGASIGSLYQFFPNKESIGHALLLEYSNELSDRLDSWKANLPSTPREFGQDLIATVFDYVSQRPACHVLAEIPAVPKADGLEKLWARVQGLLATLAPDRKDAELSAIALAASLMVRATLQGSRMVDSNKGASMLREMQRVLGCYLEERLG